MKMKDFIKHADLVTQDTWERLRCYGRPSKVDGIDTPKDLYGLTFGDLIQAQEAVRANDVQGLCYLLLGLTAEQYGEADAGEVMAFAYWVAKELERIGKMFTDLNVKPTPEQIKAGIEKLDFGLFGTLDWYCLRMGLTDHAEVEQVPWVRVYKCMEKDSKTAIYERKLQQIYEQQTRQKRTRK